MMLLVFFAPLAWYCIVNPATEANAHGKPVPIAGANRKDKLTGKVSLACEE